MASVTITGSQRNNKKNSGGGSSGSLNSGSGGMWSNKGGQSGNSSGLTANDVANYGKPTQDNYVIGQDGGAENNEILGYGSGMGYGNRETQYTWRNPDGSTSQSYSNATRYEDALKEAVAKGQAQEGAGLASSMTYGTKSSAYSPKGYGFGVVGGSKDFTKDIYSNDKQTGRWADANAMQLGFLSGRDGKDYASPFIPLSYEGNGMNNAYNKGTQFAGQGETMGGYNVNFQYPDGSTLNDVIANYQQTEMPQMPAFDPSDYLTDIYANYGSIDTPEYDGITSEEIAAQLQEIINNYKTTMEGSNQALAQQYAYQQNLRNQEAEDAARALYINKNIAQRDLPQQLAAMGRTGGLSESALLGLETNYQNAYQQNEATRMDAITQLDIAKNNAINSNNTQMAAALTELQQQSLSMQQAAAQYENQFNLSVNQMAQNQAQFNAQMAQEQSQFEAQMMWEQYSYQQQMAYEQAQDALEQQYRIAQQEQANLESAMDYALKVGDYATFESLSGLDTSVMQQMQTLEIEAALLDNEAARLNIAKKSGSGGGRAVPTAENETTLNSWNDLTNNPNVWYRANRSGGRTPVDRNSNYVM